MKIALPILFSLFVFSCNNNSSSNSGSNPPVRNADFAGLQVQATSYDRTKLEDVQFKFALAKHYRNAKGEMKIWISLWQTAVEQDICTHVSDLNSATVQRKFEIEELNPVVGVKQSTTYAVGRQIVNPNGFHTSYLFYDAQDKSKAMIESFALNFVGEATITELTNDSISINFDHLTSVYNAETDREATGTAKVTGKMTIKLCK